MEANRLCIIGNGSWATALAKIFHEKLDSINWFIREPEAYNSICQHGINSLFLSSVKFDNNKLKLFDDINAAIDNSDIVVFCIPSRFLKSVIADIDLSFKNKKVISAIKGIVPVKNSLASTYISNKLGVSKQNIGIISGPCHAEEVALERLSYLTIASLNEDLAKYTADLCSNYYIKTIISEDVEGIELSAVMKNIMAIAAGVSHGLGYGDNFTSVLIVNAIQEIKRFLDIVVPRHRDVNLSAYLGDLLVTAYSQFSRNRTFGTMIGKGYTVKSIELDMNMIAEGYTGVNSVMKINQKYNVNLPITQAVYNILYERVSPFLEMKLLSEKLR